MAVLHSSWFITFAGLLCSSASLTLVSSQFFNPLTTTAISNLYHTPHSSSYSTSSSLSTDDFILYFRGGKGQTMQELDNSLFHPQTKIFVNIMYLSFTFLPLDPILFQFFLGLCSTYYLLSGFQPLPPFSTFPHILYTCSRLTPKLNLYHHLRLPAQLLSFSSQPSSLKDQSSVTISTT